MAPNDLSDEQLLYLVGTADRELFNAGADIKQRYWEVPQRVMERLGYRGYVIAGHGKPQILSRIEAAFRLIYRASDIRGGGHIGVFMYRDIFARVEIPNVYGEVILNPFEYVDLTPTQLRIIQTEPDEIESFTDQYSDIADVGYGVREMKAEYSKNELVARYLGLAQLHLQSAAAVLTGGYDYRGVTQSVLLATELALKAGGASQGLDNKALTGFGHRTVLLATELARKWSGFDSCRVDRVLAAQPKYVANRYAAEQPERREVGHLAMGAQFIVSEVVRQLSDRNFRAALRPPQERRYPA